MNQPGKQYRWLAVGLVLAATVLIAARLADTEPRFEDRKLSAWLDDPALAEAEIERGVRAIGTNAIPQLQSWLVQRPSLLERTIRRIDTKLEYVGIGYHPSIDANFRAMRGFLVLGDLASPAVPWLEVGASRKDADFEFYLKALVACGPAGWQAFDRLERRATTNELSSFIGTLAFGLTRSPELIPRLAAYLEHPDRPIRANALMIVRLLREKCPPELLEALRHRAQVEPDDELREAVKSVVPELAKELAAKPTGPPVE